MASPFLGLRRQDFFVGAFVKAHYKCSTPLQGRRAALPGAGAGPARRPRRGHLPRGARLASHVLARRDLHGRGRQGPGARATGDGSPPHAHPRLPAAARPSAGRPLRPGVGRGGGAGGAGAVWLVGRAGSGRHGAAGMGPGAGVSARAGPSRGRRSRPTRSASRGRSGSRAPPSPPTPPRCRRAPRSSGTARDNSARRRATM